MGALLRSANRKPDDKLNILTFPTHEPYECELAKTGHNFYAFRCKEVRDWNQECRKNPSNYFLLNPGLGQQQIPVDLDIDLVLSHNKAGQFQIADQFSKNFLIPHLNMEHTLPFIGWTPQQLQQVKNLRCHRHLFISEYNREQWNGADADGVIYHAIDTDIFKPHECGFEYLSHVLTCCNDFVNRDWCKPAGQKIWTTIGFVPIEDIMIGHEVLTDDGQIHPVIKTFSRQYFGDMVEIHLSQKEKLLFTPNHNIKVLRNNQWKYLDASCLRAGDELCYPDHIQTDFSFNGTEEAWTIGLIIGDGSITDKGCVQIIVNDKEQILLDRAIKGLAIFGVEAKNRERFRARGNVFGIEASCIVFAQWLKKHIGGKKSSKCIPEFIMKGSKEIRLACLQGLWSADGSFKNGDASGVRAVFSTISPKLAAQVSHLLHSFGIKCSVNRHFRTTNKSNGQEVPIYRVCSYGNENVEKCKKLIEQGITNTPYHYIIYDVKQIREWSGMVYNCEVDVNPSYVVYPGFVAHNCCGYNIWDRVTKGLPRKVRGNTPGLSTGTKTIEELVIEYQGALIYFNSSTISPVPTAMLEAMACGCAIVTTATCMIPEIIKNGKNGFISNDENVLRKSIEILLANPELARQMGRNARETILTKFPVRNFVESWDKELRSTANLVYGA